MNPELRLRPAEVHRVGPPVGRTAAEHRKHFLLQISSYQDGAPRPNMKHSATLLNILYAVNTRAATINRLVVNYFTNCSDNRLIGLNTFIRKKVNIF